MRAPFSFWAASLLARARFRRLFAAMSLMPSICRFAALCSDCSPRHRIQPASWDLFSWHCAPPPVEPWLLRLHCLPKAPSHPSRSTYIIASGLFRPWLCQKLSWEPENKKSVRIATFLRLGIVAWLQIADRGVKTWIIGHKAADFRFAGAEGSP